MRNLKRALNLILAADMLIGMMVVGAIAVSYNDFPDREEIVNKDAASPTLPATGPTAISTTASAWPPTTIRT